MTKKLSALALGLLLIQQFTIAQFRQFSNEFLNIGAGARGLAMGSAQVASVNDVTSGYWNPAGLANIKKNPSIAAMHAVYFAGIGDYQYVSLAFPSKNHNRTLGISALRFAVDDIPNTLYLLNPDKTIDWGKLSAFSSADYGVLLSYAQMLKEIDDIKMSYGINAKIIRRVVGSFAGAWGFGIDAGFQLKKDKLLLGVTARDVTTTFNAWSFNFNEKEKEVLYLTNNDIPVKSTELTAPRLVLGGAYSFDITKSVKLLAEADLGLTFGGRRNALISSKAINVEPGVGLEASINNVFYVRAGVTNFQKALADADTLNKKETWIFQPSLGAGFKLGNITIDYSYSNLANQSNPLYSHIFSLKLDLIKKEN